MATTNIKPAQYCVGVFGPLTDIYELTSALEYADIGHIIFNLIGETEKVESNSKAVVVTPKIPDIDFSSMLLRVLNFSPSESYFSKFYGIELDKPLIKCNTLNNQLTPLLIVHYLYLIERILKKGLKKGYKIRDDNLKSKIKG